jgi:hypothetical protein
MSEESKKKSQLKWYTKNRDKILEHHREYFSKNKEKIRERNKLQYSKDRDKELFYSKQYYIAHKDRVLRRRKENHLKLRLKALIVVGKNNLKCSNCGCKDVRILEINHMNGNGSQEFKNIYRSNIKKFYTDIINSRRKIDDLNILCRVCNQAHFVKQRFGIDFDIKPKSRDYE